MVGSRLVWLMAGLLVGVVAATWFGSALAGGTPASLSPVFDALTTASAEITEDIIPAYSGVLTALVLIGVAGAVVAVVVRSR